MPKFVTIGYGDRAGYDKTPEDIREAAHKHGCQLRDEGALMGIAGKPVQVRNTLDTKVETTTGAFMSSSLPGAGFAIIEAEDLSAAIVSASKAPCAIAYGVVEAYRSLRVERPNQSAKPASVNIECADMKQKEDGSRHVRKLVEVTFMSLDGIIDPPLQVARLPQVRTRSANAHSGGEGPATERGLDHRSLKVFLGGKVRTSAKANERINSLFALFCWLIFS